MLLVVPPVLCLPLFDMEYFNVYWRGTDDRVATVFCEERIEAILSTSEVLGISRRDLECFELEGLDGFQNVMRNKVGDYVRLPDGVLSKRVR